MQIFDTVKSLAMGTHKSYQQKTQHLREFEEDFNFTMLRCTPILRPPSTESISLMWAQQHYSLCTSKWGRRKGLDEVTRVSYSATWGLCCAAPFFHKLDLITAYPDQVYIDRDRRVLVNTQVSPTNDLSYTMMNTGMKHRTGDDSRPSKGLLDQHVQSLDTALCVCFHSTITLALQLEIVRAGLANTLFWLTWAHANEVFSLQWSDMEVSNGDCHDLPRFVQVIQLHLAAQTKLDCTADLVLAHTTASGLLPGFWLDRLRSCLA